MNRPIAIFAAIAIFPLVGIGEDKIVIKGSDILGSKMVPALAKAYQEAGKKVTFEIDTESCFSAFISLLEGTGEIGMSSREIKEWELESFSAKGQGIIDWVAAYDMIGIVLNGTNRVEDLTLEQIEGIFSGDITDWSEVGGERGPISTYIRDFSSGAHNSFQIMAMRKRAYGSDTQAMADDEEVAAAVAKDKNGIGYVGLAHAERDGIKAVSVGGVELRPEKRKEYPITSSLHYYTIEGELSSAAEEFLEWALKDEKAAEIVQRVGFVPAG